MASMEFKNNTRSTVADNPLAASATILNVAPGEGSNFPSSFPFLITIWDSSPYPGDDSEMEIVKCTGRTTDALTIVRAQEGTADVAHSNGEKVAMLLTAGHFNDPSDGIITKLDTIEANAKDDQNASEVPNTPAGNVVATDVQAAINELDTEKLAKTDPTGRCATLTVAANDSSTLSKNQADYVCDGIDDDTQIQAAIDALPSNGGKIILSEGNYDIATTILYDSNITIKGMGIKSTILIRSVDTELFKPRVGDVTHFYLKSLQLQGMGKGVCSSDMVSMTPDSGSVVKYIYLDNIRFYSSGGIGIKIPIYTIGIFLSRCIAYEITGALADKDSSGASTLISLIDCIASHGGTLASVNDISGLNIIGGGGDYWDDIALIATVCGGLIQGVHFEGPQTAATISPIKLSGSQNLVFTGCRMLSIGGTHSPIWFTGWAHGSVISNCYFFSCGSNGNEIRYGGAEHLRVIDNYTTKSNGIPSMNSTVMISATTYTNVFMDTLAVSAIHIRSNEDLSAATPITFTLDAQPDVPRTLSWSFDSHAQITEYDMEVIGVDAKGNAVTETWDETAGWSGETNNAFATITSIKMTSRTGTGVGDTMDIGITDVLGVSNVIYLTSDVFKIKKNNADATIATAQVNTTYDTYDMSVITLGAGDDFTIWYKSNLNIIS